MSHTIVEGGSRMSSRVGILILLLANKDGITDYSTVEDTLVSEDASCTKFTATGMRPVLDVCLRA
jgi:hypothetical protein